MADWIGHRHARRWLEFRAWRAECDKRVAHPCEQGAEQDYELRALRGLSLSMRFEYEVEYLAMSSRAAAAAVV